MREEEEMEKGRFGDAAAFQIGYKRVQGNKMVGGKKSVGSEAEKAASLGQITTKWETMKRSNDGLVRLDVDLLEDLVEATGKIIHDREAKKALLEIKTNQLGMHGLADVLLWWKGRIKLLEAPDIPPWRARLAVIYDGLRKPWEWLEVVKEETKRQIPINLEEGEWKGWKEKVDGEEEEEGEPSRSEPKREL